MMRFIQGDCLEILPTIKSNFSLIVTDPPYNIGWNYSKKVNDRKVNYREWCLQWSKLCMQKLTDNGLFIVINYSENNNRLFCDLEDAGFNYVDQLIWHYNTNIGKSQNKYTSNYRTIIIFSKGEEWTFNPLKQPYKNPMDSRIAELIKNGSKGTNHYSVFECQLCKNVSKLKNNIGINQLPRGLVRMLISSFSNIGDKVLDPFVGNGTVMNIAEELGREGWGIDINDYQSNTIFMLY